MQLEMKLFPVKNITSLRLGYTVSFLKNPIDSLNYKHTTSPVLITYEEKKIIMCPHFKHF